MTSIEDKFYFGKRGQPERFDALNTRKETMGAYERGGEGIVNEYYWRLKKPITTETVDEVQRDVQRAIRYATEYGEEKLKAFAQKIAVQVQAFRAKSRSSRPGQPDEFDLSEACWDGYEPVGTKQKDGRTVPNCVPKAKNAKPDRFEASSINREGAEAASRSPILGALLDKNVMPSGGWRAVDTGSGVLVVDFEDQDIAEGFRKGAVRAGFTSTNPQITAGRYWKVEVQQAKGKTMAKRIKAEDKFYFKGRGNKAKFAWESFYEDEGEDAIKDAEQLIAKIDKKRKELFDIATQLPNWISALKAAIKNKDVPVYLRVRQLLYNADRARQSFSRPGKGRKERFGASDKVDSLIATAYRALRDGDKAAARKLIASAEALVQSDSSVPNYIVNELKDLKKSLRF
jgi:hypothetical protein